MGKRDRRSPDMKKIVFLFFISAIAFGGCNMFGPNKDKKDAAVKKRAKAELRDENADVDFQAFVGRLKKAVAAHDANTLASMMTEDFAYVLGATPAEDRKGDGVFKYWDENGLWTELDAILTERFVRRKASSGSRRRSLPTSRLIIPDTGWASAASAGVGSSSISSTAELRSEW